MIDNHLQRFDFGRKGWMMETNKNTKLRAILKAHGDNDEVLAVLGIERGGLHPIRNIVSRFVSVERASRVHKVPLDEMLSSLRQAIGQE